MFIELCKLFIDGSVPRVVLRVLSDLDGCVDDPHNEGGVVSALPQFDVLHDVSQTVPVCSDVEVLAYFDAAVEDEVVLYVVSPVYCRYCLPHARVSACNWRLGVTICQVDENVVENAVHLHHQSVLQLPNIDLAPQ